MGFWQHDQPTEYTLARLPDCLKDRDQLSGGRSIIPLDQRRKIFYQSTLTNRWVPLGFFFDRGEVDE